MMTSCFINVEHRIVLLLPCYNFYKLSREHEMCRACDVLICCWYEREFCLRKSYDKLTTIVR